MRNEIIALVVFGVCILLFVTNWINNCVVAIAGCIVLVVTGICSFSEAFSGFSNSTTVLIFGALVVGDATMETGLDKIIGRFIIRVCKGNEKLFILLGGVISALMSMWMANTAVVACFLPILASVCRTSDNMSMKNLTMSVTFGAMFGGVCTLVGSTPQLMAQNIMAEMSGEQFRMFDLMPVGLILTVAYLLYIQLFGYRLGNKIWGDRHNEGVELSGGTGEEELHLDRRKLVTLVIIFALMVLSYVLEWLPPEITSLSAAMLCFITRCADFKTTMRRMDWHTLFFLAGCTGMANGLMATELDTMMVNGMNRLFGNSMNPYVMLAIVVLAAMLVSNFMANATTMAIFTPVVISVCHLYGFNVIPFCLATTYAAATTCATPMAHAQVTMTLVAGYRFSDYTKANLPVQLLTFVIIMVFVPLFFPLVG